MKNALKDWLGAIIYLLALTLFLILMEHDGLFRETIKVDGQDVHVNVEGQQKVSYQTVSTFGAELFIQNGKVMAKRGIWGGRGRPPIFYSTVATPFETAVYHRYY